MALPHQNRSLRLVQISLAATAALYLASCGGSQKMPDRGPAEVGVVTLVAQPVTMSTELTGRTNATKTAEVRPQVDGIILRRLFTEGSMVKAGQALYQIDARLYRTARDQAAAQVANAEASLVTAGAKLSRYRQLTEADAVSRQDLDDAVATQRQSRAAVAQYKATLATADVNLGFTRVYAPISGRIGRSASTEGALVTSGQSTALATIQQLDPIFVDIQQSSTDLLNLRQSLAKGETVPASTSVTLVLENGTTYSRTGRIQFNEVSVDTGTGTVTVRATFPNPDGLLLPGMFVRVQLPQGSLKQGILAPQQGVTRDARGNATALVVGQDNKVALRRIVASQAIGNRWLVSNGLKAGDRLIVEGVDRAETGAAVKPVQVKLAGTK